MNLRRVLPAFLVCCLGVAGDPASAGLSDTDRQLVGEVVSLIETHHGQAHDHTDLMRRATDAVEAAYAKPATPAGPSASASSPDVSPAEQGIKAFVAGLGPHNFYATGSQARQRQAWFVGAPKARLGLIGTTTARGFAIRLIYPDGPADRAGLLPDDLVIAINGQPLPGQSRKQVAELLQGTDGEQIGLTLRRGEATLDVMAIFDQTDTASVLSRRFGNTGYLWISRFNQQMDTGFRRAVDDLTPFGPAIEPVTGLIIDLRNNQGGYLRQAISLSDSFLSDGHIARVDGRHETAPRLYDAKPGEDFRGLPVVILVNSVTRSSAEIFAAALRDNGRAVLMGQTTYGKGVGQRTYKVAATGGSLTLVRTIVTPPSGRVFDGIGLNPDISLQDNRTSGLDTALCPPLAASPFSDSGIACAIAYLKAGSVQGFYESLGTIAGPTAGPGQKPE
ncbi:MAG: S41 family peptidase [Rhodospirillales bacterium]